MGPWLLVAGLVGAVVFLATKRSSVEVARQGELPENTAVPHLGAATNSPATAGSLTASTLYQAQARTFESPVGKLPSAPGTYRPGSVRLFADLVGGRHTQNLQVAGSSPVSTTPPGPTGGRVNLDLNLLPVVRTGRL